MVQSVSTRTALDVRGQVSAEEWSVRQDLAAAYRLVAHYGWDDLIFTHISARVPGPAAHFLINPYGFMFDEITASSLVKIDLDGAVVLDNGYPVNTAGYTIHSAVHMAREDAHAVMHLHTDAASVQSIEATTKLGHMPGLFGSFSESAWPALRRMLDRVDSSYQN